MIELSVVMPMFRAKRIGWLAFESLIRQKNINFEWELIIAEEMFDYATGEEEILKYKPKLEEIGCVRFKYIGLEEWIFLSEKLHLLVNECDLESKIFVWQSADYFSAPLRLSTHYKIFNENKTHLVVPTKAIYYKIAKRKIILQDVEMPEYNKLRTDDVIGKAWNFDVIRKIPLVDLEKGLDGWLRKQVQSVVGKDNLITIYDQTDNWKHALATDGFHNLAIYRWYRMKRLEPPFIECPIDINETIPKDILDRLDECREFIIEHKLAVKKGLPVGKLSKARFEMKNRRG